MRAGDGRRADRLAECRAEALVALAERAAPQRAGRPADVARATGSWLLPLPVLAKRRQDAPRDGLALDDE